MARYINFGKYKGKTIEDLLTDNPGYLAWAIENNISSIVSKLSPQEKKQIIDSALQSKHGIKDDKTQIHVTCKGSINPTTNNNVMIFSFYGLNKDDAWAIRNVLDKNNEKYTSNAIVKGDALIVRVNQDDLEKWFKTGLNTMQSILLKSNRYDSDEIMHLGDEIYARSGNGMTRGDKVKDYKEAKNKAIEVWKEYIKKLNDPETRKIIEMYSALPLSTKEYGHVLSKKNAMLIRSVNSDATFILPLSGWRELNRGINKGAKRYVVYIPQGTEEQIKQVKDVINSLGWNKVPYDELPEQVRRKVDIETKGVSAKIFVPIYEYDYADTYLFKGKPDLFNQTIGLRNNLTGELNALAKVDATSGNNATMDEIMIKRTELANDYFSKYCEKNEIQYTPSENASLNLVNALLSKYKKDAMTLDILRDVNIKHFAENATHLTLLIGKYAYDMLGMFSHGYEYDNKEVGEMINVVGRTITDINNNIKMNESLEITDNPDFVKKFMKAFKSIGCSIKKNRKTIDESYLRCLVKEALNDALKKN